jgi:hypothetical protein
MSYGLIGKSGMKLTDKEIHCKGGYNQGDDSAQKMGLLKKNEIPKGAHGTKPAALGDETDAKANDKGDDDRSMHSTGSFQTVKEDTGLILTLDLRKNEHEDEKKNHNARHEQTHSRIGFGFPAQGVARFEKPGPDVDAKHQTQKTEDGVSIPTGQAEHGPPGTAQKDQGPDHGEHAQDKADNRRRSCPGAKIFKAQSGDQGPKNKANDLWTHVLHNPCPVHTHSPGDIPLKAGHADSHVARITPLLEQGGKDSDYSPNTNDSPPGSQKILHNHLPFLLLRLPITYLFHFAICIRSSWALAQKKTNNPMIFSNTKRYYVL